MVVENSYPATIAQIKTEIETARLKAAISVNQHLLVLYWKIGSIILQQQVSEGWGTKVIERLANDLRREFPDMKGTSARNLKYMRAFAEAYPEFVQQPAAQSSNSSIVQPPVAQLMNNDPNIQSTGMQTQNNLIVQAPLAQSEPNTIMQQPAAQLDYAEFVQQPVAQLENNQNTQQTVGKSESSLIVQAPLAQLEADTIVQAPLAQLTWYHHITLIDKVKNIDERIFYINKTAENNWSRNVLVHQIESGLFKRQGKSVNNFNMTLPQIQSDLAREMLKDPYKFDFLNLAEEYFEKDLEDALISHITKFLLELGAGFSYVGRQYHLEIGGEDFYMDLLFYHLKLRSYVVIELKTGKFIPEYASKLNFYLSAVDDLLKHHSDNPTLGILICKERNKIIAEYALRDINKPIGIAAYELTQSIPDNFKGSLPTIEEIEQELEK